jgi:hypothetical protein
LPPDNTAGEQGDEGTFFWWTMIGLFWTAWLLAARRLRGARAGGRRRAASRSTFDLVLADIRLADGDGFEILAHCRGASANSGDPDHGYATIETGIESRQGRRSICSPSR